MEEEAPVIYGLELQARTLAAQTAETDCVRFLVGTQSLKCENQVHLLQYDEEINVLSKTVLLHEAGEVWYMSASPTDADLLATCFNHITPDSKCEMGSAIWRLPAASQLNDPLAEDSTLTFPALEEVVKFDISAYGTEIKSLIWHPTERSQVLSVVDNHFLLWDLEASSTAKVRSKATVDLKGKPKVTTARWNPHHNCNSIALSVDNSVRGWDLRTMQQSWLIDSAHGQMVRDLDFNPNRQYYIATCGDDCQAKFWDIRNPKESVLTLSDHSHWVWSVRYNHFHDQLVLTSSSDSRVILTRVISISSEPFGHLVEEEENCDDEHEKKAQQDGVISIYEEHEDSVYAVEWSSADPWLFASLSYDGRLVINKVPRTEKYRILL